MELQEFQTFLEDECILIFDTNVFLDLYRYSVNTSRLALNILKELISQIWLPRQVYDEFIKNYEEEQRKAYSKYSKIERELNGRIDSFSSDLSKDIKRFKKYDFPNLDQLDETVSNIIEQLKAEVNNVRASLRELENENRQIFNDGEIQGFIQDLHDNNNIGIPYGYRELIEIYKEGEVRYSYNIPPGYKDKNKKTLDKFGDLIVWKQILDYLSDCTRNILFITNDTKEDWWKKESNNNYSIREELVKEINEYIGSDEQKFYMLRFNEFLNLYTTYTNRNEILALAELNLDDYISESMREITNGLKEFVDTKEYKELISKEIFGKYNCIINDFDFEEVIIDNVDDGIVELDNEENKLIYNVNLIVRTNGTGYIGDTEYDLEIEWVANYLIKRIIVNQEVEERYSYSEVIDKLVEDINLIFDEYDEDICIKCGERFGEYNFNDEGMICDRCSNSYDCCPDCGKYFSYEDMRDGFCEECSYEH